MTTKTKLKLPALGAIIPFDEIKKHSQNPRRPTAFKGSKFEELKSSLEEGLVNALTLVAISDYRDPNTPEERYYYIVDGNRRWVAINQLLDEGKWPSENLVVGVSCTVQEVTFKKSLLLIAQSNGDGNETFTIREQAHLIRDMRAQRMSLKVIGKSFGGKTDGWVRDRARLFQAFSSESEREPYYNGEIPLWHLRSNYPSTNNEPIDVIDDYDEFITFSVNNSFQALTEQVAVLDSSIENLGEELSEEKRGHLINIKNVLEQKVSEVEETVREELGSRDYVSELEAEESDELQFRSIEDLERYFKLGDFANIESLVSGAFKEVPLETNKFSTFAHERLGLQTYGVPELPDNVALGFISISDYEEFVGSVKDDLKRDKDLIKKVKEIRRFVRNLNGRIRYIVICPECEVERYVSKEDNGLCDVCASNH